MARVIISAGHTTNSPGTVANGLREVDIARSIAKATIPHLRQNGILTLSVPYELELKQKIDWINNTGYQEQFNDICLEIHVNESDGKKSGVEIWYKDKGHNKSQQLADTIITYVTKDTKLPNNGCRSEYDHELKGLAFVHNTSPIGVLIECGYLDNPKDANFLRDQNNMNTIGKSIAKAILKFLNIEYKEVKIPAINKVQQPVQTKLPNQQTTQQYNNLQPYQQSFKPTVAPPQQNMPISQPPITPTPYTQPPVMGGYSNYSQNIGGGMQQTGGSYLSNREDRKKMIQNYYVKILGREPNQSDLNYFLNTGITEDQLVKKMIDSQEHADLVKARQEVLSTKAQFHGQQAELIQLRAETRDKSELINHLNTLLAQKNIALTELQRRLSFYSQQPQSADQQQNKKNSPNYHEPFVDKVFKFFSDRLG